VTPQSPGQDPEGSGDPDGVTPIVFEMPSGEIAAFHPHLLLDAAVKRIPACLRDREAADIRMQRVKEKVPGTEGSEGSKVFA